jgi:tRNA threonylcarbamoyladenosine biosynthesis protein TsaE
VKSEPSASKIGKTRGTGVSRKRAVIDSHSASQTKRIGTLIGRFLKPGSLVALSGELGTGKTQLIKGLARGLGVDRKYDVSSPSFVLINEYPGDTPLYHIDLYRLSEGTDLEELGLEEYVYGNGVTAVEWAEKASPFIPLEHIWISIQWKGPRHRQLIIKAVGRRNVEIIEAVHKDVEESGS